MSTSNSKAPKVTTQKMKALINDKVVMPKPPNDQPPIKLPIRMSQIATSKINPYDDTIILLSITHLLGRSIDELSRPCRVLKQGLPAERCRSSASQAQEMPHSC